MAAQVDSGLNPGSTNKERDAEAQAAKQPSEPSAPSKDAEKRWQDTESKKRYIVQL